MERIGNIIQDGLEAAKERRDANTMGARKLRVEDMFFQRILENCRPLANGRVRPSGRGYNRHWVPRPGEAQQ